MNTALNLEHYIDTARQSSPLVLEGRVVKVVGLVIEGDGPAASVGDMCYIYPGLSSNKILAEVVGFQHGNIQLMPLGTVQGLTPGSRIVPTGSKAMVNVGENILGRVVDGLGAPIDGLGPLQTDTTYPIHGQPSNPLARARITETMDVGVRCINA